MPRLRRALAFVEGVGEAWRASVGAARDGWAFAHGCKALVNEEVTKKATKVGPGTRSHEGGSMLSSLWTPSY
jgi:hypothetical protein